MSSSSARAFVWAIFMLAVALVAAQPALSRTADKPGAVVYTPPSNELHQPLYERLKREQWLERMQAVLQVFRMPREVTLKVEGCGEVDAYFTRRTVAVCYEYLQVVVRRIEAGQLPAWVDREEALAGAFVDAMLHEYAHALIEHLKIPVLGREEDAADQMAAHLMLMLGGKDAAGLVRGTAHLYLSWISYFQSRPSSVLSTGAPSREARAHPTAAQRLYNIVCLAYGADRATYQALATAIDLPESRAEDCAEEYDRLAHAYRTLLGPHLIKSREAAAREALRSFVAQR